MNTEKLNENKNYRKFIAELPKIFNNTSSTYKFWWFLAICEEVAYKNDENISFGNIAKRMFSNSFYAIKHGVLFCNPETNKKSDHLKKFIDDNNIVEPKLNDEQLNLFEKKFSKKVKYRLLEPFYKDQLEDRKINAKKKYLSKNKEKNEKNFDKIWEGTGSNEFTKDYHIQQLSDKTCIFYKINNDKTITLCSWALEFIYENFTFLQGFTWFNLIKKLNRVNNNFNNENFDLLNNLFDENKTRQMQLIINIYTNSITPKDPYNKNKPILSNVSIDHIIPFSFIQNDEIWNLVPTTKSTNSAKNDKIANLDEYFEFIKVCQWELFDTLRKQDPELCEKVYSGLNIKLDIDQTQFWDSLKNKLTTTANNALKNNFELWQRR